MINKIALHLSNWDKVIKIMGFPKSVDDIYCAVETANNENHSISIDEFKEECILFYEAYLQLLNISSIITNKKRMVNTFQIVAQVLHLLDNTSLSDIEDDCIYEFEDDFNDLSSNFIF